MMFIYLDEKLQGRKQKLGIPPDKPLSENILCILKKHTQKIQAVAFKDFIFSCSLANQKFTLVLSCSPGFYRNKGFLVGKNTFFSTKSEERSRYVLFS